MSVKLAIVMDPIEQINFKKDSSLAMLLAANARNWSLSYMQIEHLFLKDGRAFADIQDLQVFNDPEHFYHLSNPRTIALSELDCILMRKDPPFDNEYIYSTYILEAAEREGCLVVNKPQALRDCNEKLFATQFPSVCPPHVVSRSDKQLRAFYEQHQDIILKPLDGMGGAKIFRLKAGDPNVSVIIETLTEFGQQQIMAQKYLPAITEGDKRILLINGHAVDYCLARIPAKGETRGNLAAGGSGVAQPLSDSDRKIAELVGPVLREKGLLFVGLDVIGEGLTEINVTSPTCIREIDAAYATDIGSVLMDAIEEQLNKK